MKYVWNYYVVLHCKLFMDCYRDSAGANEKKKKKKQVKEASKN